MSLTLSERAKNIAPSLTLKIDAKAKDMKAKGIDVIGFGAGEPDFDTPQPICDAAKDALDKGMTRYTPVAGTLPLRQAICDKLLRENHLAYEPADIIVSSGAKHSLFTIFQTILNEGDEVLIPTPCWVSYPEMVRMAGGTPVYVPTSEEENFVPTSEAIQKALSPRTKAFILTSPSNPNGSVWTREQLSQLAALATAHDFFIISDEIYEKLIYDGLSHLSIASLSEEAKAHTLVVNGMSKVYAMTGWRIGYTAGPREVIKAMTNFQSQSASNPNSIAQYASLMALQGDQSCVDTMREAFEARRNYMVERINAIEGLHCLKPQGAFYIMLNIKDSLGKRYKDQRIDDSMTFANLLLSEKHVAVVPGVAFEAEGYCRLSYAISMEGIKEGLDRIAQFVSELS